MNAGFEIKQNNIIPMISIDISNKGMVGYFTDEKKIIIHWGLNEIAMTGDQALQLCDMIKALIKHDQTLSEIQTHP